VRTLVAMLWCLLLVPTAEAGDGRKAMTTAAFQVRYDRTIAASDMKLLGEMLDSAASEYQAAFQLTLKNKPVVLVSASVSRYQSESVSRLFDDGDSRGGRIYLALPPKRPRTEGMQGVVHRTVAKLLLDRIPACPRWLAEAYTLYAGGDLDRFGSPAEVNAAGFSDLGEDFVRIEELRQLPDLYATLAFTIKFLVDRYGKERVEEALAKFRTQGGIELVFSGIFQEPYAKIESEWSRALRARTAR